MTRKSRAKLPGKSFKFHEADCLYVGIDVHKRKHHVAVWSELIGGIIAAWTCPADRDAISRTLARLRDNVLQVVYEAGPTGFSLARTLINQGFPTAVVSANQIAKFSADQEKSDRRDAAELAFFASRKLIDSVYIPEVEEEVDRALMRRRATVMKEIRRVKVRIKQLLLFHGIAEPEELKHWSLAGREILRKLPLSAHLRTVLNGLLRDLTHYEKEEKIISAELDKLASHEPYAEKKALLETIPGVGKITAMSFLLELPRPERFERKEEVAKMLGLAPRIRSSGQRRLEMGRMVGGKNAIRTHLIEAAWQWVRKDPGARERFLKLVSNTGNEKKKAITAMARRLGIIMWRMLVRGEAYRPLEMTS